MRSPMITTTKLLPSDACDGDVLEPKPKTAAVLGLLALTSLTFSYLGAYAIAGALVNGEILHRWHPDHDPRPRWLLTSFCVLMLLFMCVGGFVRQLSRRQLRQIDEMGDETDAVERPLRSSLTP
jgi:hypothetical protein